MLSIPDCICLTLRFSIFRESIWNPDFKNCQSWFAVLQHNGAFQQTHGLTHNGESHAGAVGKTPLGEPIEFIKEDSSADYLIVIISGASSKS